MSLSKMTPVQDWSPTLTEEELQPLRPDSSYYALDSTWMLSHEFQAANKTNFLFKAGNKVYTLDGTSKNGNSSELSLRKKYS